MNKIRLRAAIVVIFCISVFILSGCIAILKASFDLSISLNQNWSFTSTIVVSPNSADLLINALSQRFATGTKARQLGITYNIQKLGLDQSGNIPVQFSASGTGYDKLNQFFGEQVISVDESGGSRVLVFELNIGINGVQSTDFTLHGGKILYHNGVLVDEKTVQWLNYTGTMSARMQEPSLLDNLLWIILGVAVLVILGVLGLIVLFMVWRATRRSNSVQQPVYSNNQNNFPSQPMFTTQPPRMTQQPGPQNSFMPTHAKFCLQCGAQIPMHSTFCPMCGAKQARS